MIGLLQSATGGSATVVLLVFVALASATVLSTYLAVRLYSGYRATGGREMAMLGLGIVLVTTAPILLRLVLSNAAGTDATTRALAATACQVLGLLLILGVVYDRH